MRDIKPPVAVPDYSLFLFIALVVLALLLAGVIGYFIYKTLQKDPKREVLEKLEALDLSDPKRDAYAVTPLGRQLLVDEQLREKFAVLNARLERYKYKKEVAAVDGETKKQLALFIELVHGRI